MDFELSKSLVRVHLTDLFNPDVGMKTGLLNPQSLRYSTRVSIAELNPVNWSHGILQYSHTGSTSIPLSFYFSAQLTPRVGGSAALLTYYADWFHSFCFPNDLGAAPPPMLLIWPHTIEKVLVIESVDVTMERFFSGDLSPAAVRVNISAKELRYTFRTARLHRMSGMQGADPVVRQYSGVGSPLNLKGGRGE